MASLTDEEKRLFPLRTVRTVVNLFRSIISRTKEPDLALLSIVAGYVENTLTNATYGCCVKINAGSDSKAAQDSEDFPPLELNALEGLVAKFKTVVKSSVDVPEGRNSATREIIKKVSDAIWNTLTRSYYKDRAHLQNLYSYLTENKLDCFGVALAVTIACQVLGFADVHLALSEDHAWVVFGDNALETVEVTWHGKGNEDRRGQSIDSGIQAKSWLYAAGNPVLGSRYTEVAAIVSSVNPSISATTDSMEVAVLQQNLLWLLYDLGHLSKYPMALGNLADLEELNPTMGRPHCSHLFSEATDAGRRFYDNCLVYPYTYQGGYFYRNRLFKEALESWANAADVIRKYNYSREDEEIYKEFLEIANELIPHVMKVEASGHSPKSILKDPECFAHLLRFYDGICQWEEGSSTPVLHIGWAKPLVNTISKFDAEVRSHVTIECSNAEDPFDDNSDKPRDEGIDVEYKDANANDVLLEWRQDHTGPVADQLGGSLASADLAALTELCGRTLLSPAFFLGKKSCMASPTAAPVAPYSKIAAVFRQRDSQKARPQQLRSRLRLRSQKMAGLKDLLLSEKLNTQAISLQLTAQSQVQLGGRKVRDDVKESRIDKESIKDVVSSRPKRQRKE